jgi:hypothetical protein
MGIRSSIATFSLTVVLVAVGATFGRNSANQSSNFEIRYPEMSQLHSGPCSLDGTTPCVAEAAALASALQSLEIARNAADIAYQAWVKCLDENGPPPLHETGASILESSK